MIKEGWKGTNDQYQNREAFKGNNRISMVKKQYQSFTQNTTINSKWILKLNLKAKRLSFLEEIIGENLCNLVVGKDFLGHKKQKP